MSTPNDFFYCQFANGVPVPGLFTSVQTQQQFPEIKTDIDNLTAEELGHIGLIRVVLDPYPVDGYTYAQGLPELHNDMWVASWVQQPTPDREQRMTERNRLIRNDRNSALSQCDWTQMPDAPLTAEQKTAWATYRQDLRDLTKQPDFPWKVTWPVSP